MISSELLGDGEVREAYERLFNLCFFFAQPGKSLQDIIWLVEIYPRVFGQEKFIYIWWS